MRLGQILPRSVEMFVGTVCEYASVWFDDPKSFRSFDEFLGFQIGRFLVTYGFDGDDLPMLCERVHQECKFRNFLGFRD